MDLRVFGVSDGYSNYANGDDHFFTMRLSRLTECIIFKTQVEEARAASEEEGVVMNLQIYHDWHQECQLQRKWDLTMVKYFLRCYIG